MILELDPFYKLLKNSTNIDFAENQILPNSNSFSLRTTNLLSIMQHTRVRPSGHYFYKAFSLFVVNSFGFGFY